MLYSYMSASGAVKLMICFVTRKLISCVLLC